MPPGNTLGHRFVAHVARSRLGIRFMQTVGTRLDPFLIRFSGGRFSCVAPFPAMLLTTVGARSGLTRTSAVVYFTDSGRVVAIASNFGSTASPGWYHNIGANPNVTLRARNFAGPFRAETVTGDERDRLYRLASGSTSPYESYQRSAGSRQIPVVVFHPIS